MTYSPHRRHAFRLLAVALAAAGTVAPALVHAEGESAADSLRFGKVFMSTNSLTGNEVLVFAGSQDGAPSLLSRFATQGLGTGAGLGSQGAVTLSGSGRHLFVVNASSNTLSTFAVNHNGLVLTSVVDTGGATPTSVAENDGLVYVLNAGGAGNVTGFRNVRGVLTPIAGSARGLSASGGTAPAQVSFNRDGDVLVVAERNTNLLSSFSVRKNGTLGTRLSTPTAGTTPFGFAVTNRDVLVLSEAATSSVSSFRFNEESAALRSVTRALPNGQGAACWIAVTPNGRFAYSANAATSNVSSFGIGKGGQLTLLAGVAGVTGPGAGALDMSVSADGQQLHVFASRAPQQIVTFSIAYDGSLTRLGSVGGIPAGSAGMAAN